MKIPEWLPVYGDMNFRGPCPSEAEEQVTLFAEMRRRWPDTLGKLALHPRNEGKRNWRRYSIEHAEGLAVGAADVIIPGHRSLVLELKILDHTRARLTNAEHDYLLAAHRARAFVAIALGYKAGLDAISDWLASEPKL